MKGKDQSDLGSYQNGRQLWKMWEFPTLPNVGKQKEQGIKRYKSCVNSADRHTCPARHASFV